MASKKPWQECPPRGSAVDHPDVLRMAQGRDPGTRPRVVALEGRRAVHYSRPRLYLDRDAWELLRAPDDVLVQRVRPRGEEAFSVALTLTELEAVFGSVRGTRSWDDQRCYHFPKLPPAAASYRVGSPLREAVAPKAPMPARAPSTSPTASARVRRRRPPTTSTAGDTPHEWAEAWARRLGGRAESAGYLASVEDWRNTWRPERVRVLLIAESHVAEEPGDSHVQVRVPGRAGGALPRSFCRLVYCLGYGESELCKPRPRRNPGTWQFWDIFGAIAGGPAPLQPRKSSSTLGARLAWKLDVLRWLQRHGVWLVDACVAGVYRPGGSRAVSGVDYDRMVRESFERFVWPGVSAESPEVVGIIGAGVQRALAHHEATRGAITVVQPQGDRGSGRHARELAELAAEARRAVPPRP